MGRLPVLALSVSALSLFPGLQTTASAQASDILFKSQGAQEQIADPALPADYRDIVRLYASGAHAEALAALGGWTEARKVSDGTYFYILEIKRMNKENEIIKGSIFVSY